MEKFGKFMAVVLAIIVNAIVNGFVFQKMWLWFIVPIFSTHPIKIVEAIGVVLLIDFIRSKRDKDKVWEILTLNIVFNVMMAVVTLLGGYIIKMFT